MGDDDSFNDHADFWSNIPEEFQIFTSSGQVVKS
jgi:hypothetical protein